MRHRTVHPSPLSFTRIWQGHRISLAFLITLLAALGLPVSIVQAATITVTTTEDEVKKDGDCSLREAIIAANQNQTFDDCAAGNGKDTINVPPGTYLLTIASTGNNGALTGDLDLIEDIIVKGAGRTKTIINGGGLERVFDLAVNVSVAVSELTVTNGGTFTDPGGAFYVGEGATLSLQNSSLTNNKGSNGGAIFIDNDGTAELTNSWVNDNQADTRGGGIYVDSNATLTLTGSQVNHNTVTNDDGGGISVNRSKQVTVTHSQVNGNAANSWGGGIFNIGGVLTIMNSQMKENTTETAGGGALHTSGSGNTAMISHSQIISNTGPNGGGIYSERGALELVNNQISHNTAAYGGGLYSLEATLLLINSTISGNESVVDGGGIYLDLDNEVDFYNVTITDNTADSDSDEDGQGGGIFFYEPTEALTATHTIIGANVDRSPSSKQPDCSGSVTSAGYNLIQNTTGCVISGDLATTLIGVSPNLGPLQNNGGDTLTHALLAGSPAIDAGNPAGCTDHAGLPLTTDQRGFARPVDGDGNGSVICDMGAYEFASDSPPDPEPADDYGVYLPIIHK
ncbi:MAG: CSLREA domain-containing protein [Anaerolineae bacterium]|nr:CSLREA domain-containing protein [Anaerolineae bacterium]